MRPTLLALALVVAMTAAQLTPAPAAAATHNVNVADDVFQPSTISITVGDTVQWTFVGANPHSVTSQTAGLFDSGIQTGGTFSHTFNAEGTFAYICVVHGASMSGSVSVGSAPTSTPQPPTNTPVPTATSTPSATGTAAAAPTATPAPPDTPRRLAGDGDRARTGHGGDTRSRRRRDRGAAAARLRVRRIGVPQPRHAHRDGARGVRDDRDRRRNRASPCSARAPVVQRLSGKWYGSGAAFMPSAAATSAAVSGQNW